MSQSKPSKSDGLSDLDEALVKLAVASPAAAFVRTMSTHEGRRAAASAIALAAQILVPARFKTPGGADRTFGSVSRFAAACELKWHLLGKSRFGELRAALLSRGLAVATVNRVLMSIRGVMKQCWLARRIDAEGLERAREELQAVSGSTVARGRHLTKPEVARLFQACSGPGISDARDAALLALMAVGLRRAEIAVLRMADLDLTRGRLRVQGKGHKERIVHLTGGALKAVESWIQRWRGKLPGPIFFPIHRGGGAQADRAITAQLIYKRLRFRAKIAGVSCSPHDLRRTFAGDALSARVDISTVQQILGHASPATTARYDLRPEETQRAAMDSVEVPFLGQAD
ncbi:MAG: site-specific integrase [Planctomycetes bacterium]|nr:site-specific integrase [Planctomycetota bacterium]